MWAQIILEASSQSNYNFGFSTHKSDVLIHLSQWQYWWWFWFSLVWVAYYYIVLYCITKRVWLFNPVLNTSLRSHGKWGDFLVALIPLSWCGNILVNSNFILRMIEWQNESSLFTLRVQGKQWYWVYKFDADTASNVLTAPKNVGNNNWVNFTANNAYVSQSYYQAIQLAAQLEFFDANKDLLVKAEKSQKYLDPISLLTNNRLTSLGAWDSNYSSSVKQKTSLKYFNNFVFKNRDIFFQTYFKNSLNNPAVDFTKVFAGHTFSSRVLNSTPTINYLFNRQLTHKIKLFSILEFLANQRFLSKPLSSKSSISTLNFFSAKGVNYKKFFFNNFSLKLRTISAIQKWKSLKSLKYKLLGQNKVVSPLLEARFLSFFRKSTLTLLHKLHLNKPKVFSIRKHIVTPRLSTRFSIRLSTLKTLLAAQSKARLQFAAALSKREAVENSLKSFKHHKFLVSNLYLRLRFRQRAKIIIQEFKNRRLLYPRPSSLSPRSKYFQLNSNFNFASFQLRRRVRLNFDATVSKVTKKSTYKNSNLTQKKVKPQVLQITRLKPGVNRELLKKLKIAESTLSKKKKIEYSKSPIKKYLLFSKLNKYSPETMLFKGHLNPKLTRKSIFWDNLISNFYFHRNRGLTRYLSVYTPYMPVYAPFVRDLTEASLLSFLKKYNVFLFNVPFSKLSTTPRSISTSHFDYIKLDDTSDTLGNIRSSSSFGPLRLMRGHLNLHNIERLRNKPTTNIFFKFKFSKLNDLVIDKTEQLEVLWGFRQKKYKRLKKFVFGPSILYDPITFEPTGTVPSTRQRLVYNSFLPTSLNLNASNYVKVYSEEGHPHTLYTLKSTSTNSLIASLDTFQTSKSQSEKQITNTSNFDTHNYYKTVRFNRHRNELIPITLARRLLRTKRTLVLPAHVNITVITNSYDVVHSWFIPGLGLKLDCVPGRSTHHTFYVDNIGFYYGQCAEICGRYHHHMPIRICAIPFEHFVVWWQTKGLPRLHRLNNRGSTQNADSTYNSLHKNINSPLGSHTSQKYLTTYKYNW